MSVHHRTKLIKQIEFHGFTISKYEPFGMWFITDAPKGVFVVSDDGSLWRPACLRTPRYTQREAERDVLDYLANNKNTRKRNES